jgi:hypothetical protein
MRTNRFCYHEYEEIDEMATTEHTGVAFDLKESGDGTPWLMVNLDEPGLSCVKSSDFLGLQFREHVTFQEAQEFRSQLRQMVKGMSLTKF